jgi:hypothetical protein
MRVLVGCERFGRVRDAFIEQGHETYSCDLVAASGPHLQMDVFEAIESMDWDLGIFFPDCTYVCGSGLHWNKRRPERQALTDAAVEFFIRLYNCKIPKVAMENPIGCLSTRFRKPDQIIQPWQFGDDASKATCIWKRGLPDLISTNVLPGGRLARRSNQTPSGQNKLGPSPERAMMRAMTYPGIAKAMAEQWGQRERKGEAG